MCRPTTAAIPSRTGSESAESEVSRGGAYPKGKSEVVSVRKRNGSGESRRSELMKKGCRAVVSMRRGSGKEIPTCEKGEEKELLF